MLTQSVKSQQTQQPKLVYCWAIVYDVGPALNQHQFNVSVMTDNYYQEQELMQMLF